MAGPIARTVSDAAVLLEVIQGYDEKDPITADGAIMAKRSYRDALVKGGLRGARIGVLRSFFGNKPEHEEVNRLVGRAIARMESLGAEPVELEAPLDVEQLIATMDVQKWESKTQIDAWLRDLGPGAPKIHSFDGFSSAGVPVGIELLGRRMPNRRCSSSPTLTSRGRVTVACHRRRLSSS